MKTKYIRYDAIVIGAGPAGLMAAATAAAAGLRVIVIDKNNITGRKLRITGKGRCNITNACSFSELMENIPTNPKFLFSSFKSFSNTDIISFFESIGVKTVVERGSRVFPASQRAGDVADALTEYTVSCGAEIMLHSCVTEILTEEGAVTGVRIIDSDTKKQSELYSDAVIVACGGVSYPLTGSTGDGYTFARAAGHSITAPHASLAALISNDSFMSRLAGLSLRNVEISLYVNDAGNINRGKPVYKDFGELLFTGTGISGPVVLSASAFYKGACRAVFSIDMKPALDEKQLYTRIGRDFELFDRKIFANALDKLLPRKMIPVFVDISGIQPTKQVNQITRTERERIVYLLKNFDINIDGIDDVKNAIVTAGGVSVKEINPRTMESTLCRGLYFAGEVIDVDGYTGGFNLTIAFSTGHAAGAAAAIKHKACFD